MTNNDANPLLVVSEPRCKVCRSEHRAEIDAMLRGGASQTDVRHHFNDLLGHEHFTPNNLSVHARKHLYGPDPEDWVRRAARARRMLGDPSALPVRATPEDALRAVVEIGLRSIDAGVSIPEPGDVIRAVSELKRIERDGERATEAELLRQIKAFTTAVKNHLPEDKWDAMYHDFEVILAESGGSRAT